MAPLHGRWRYLVVVVSAAVVAATAASPSNGARNSSLGAPQGVSAKTITFGFSSGLEGPYALAGKQEQSGILAAFAEANASGGVDGRQLKLTSLNDNFDPTLGLTNYRNFATQTRVYGVVGSVFLVPTAIYQVAGPLGIPTFPLFSYPDPHLKNVFLLGATSTAQSVAAVNVLAHLYKSGQKVKVGLIATGSESVSPVIDALKANPRFDLVYSEPNVPFTSTDMTPYVLAAKSANAQAMLMFAGSTQDLLFMQTAAQQSFKPLYIGNGGTMAESPMLTLPSCQLNCYRVSEFSATSPGYQTFAKWVKKVGGQPSDQGAEEFAITQTMIQILRLSGKDLSWSHFESVAQTKLKNFSTGGLYQKISFGPQPGGHLGSPYTITARVTNGQWKSLGSFVREPKQFDSTS